MLTNKTVNKMSEHNSVPFPVGGESDSNAPHMTALPSSRDDSPVWDMGCTHVSVDQTPLQVQIQRNKECKYKYVGYSFAKKNFHIHN